MEEKEAQGKINPKNVNSKFEDFNKKKKNLSHNQVPKPDEIAYEQQMKDLNDKIESLRLKSNELTQLIKSKKVQRDEFNRKKADLASRLDELHRTETELDNQRSILRKKIDEKKKEGYELKSNALNLKKSIGYSSEDEIDKKIREIEDRMMTTTISLKEEKQLLTYISQLKANKPLIGKFSSLEASALRFEDNSIGPLKENLEKIRQQFITIRTARRHELESLKNLIQERKAVADPVKDLFEERNSIKIELDDLYQKKRDLKEKFQLEIAKYQEYLFKVRLLRQEQIKEEKQRRAFEQERLNLEKQLEKVDEYAYNDETSLLQQTISYVKKLINSRDEKTTTTEQTCEQDQEGDFQGCTAQIERETENELDVRPKQVKNIKKLRSKNNLKPKKLKFDIRTFQYFEQCGVKPPVKDDELECCLKELEEKLQALQVQQAQKILEIQERKKEIQAQLNSIVEKKNNESTKLKTIST